MPGDWKVREPENEKRGFLIVFALGLSREDDNE